MVVYVDNRLLGLSEVIERLGDQLDRHEDYHRDALQQELAAAKNARVAWWAVGVSLAVGVASIVLDVAHASGKG